MKSRLAASGKETASPATLKAPEETTMMNGVPSAVLPESPSYATLESGHEATGRVRRVVSDPASPWPVYLGIAIVALGFALIGVAWADVASRLNVAVQVPYLVSAGFTGLGLIMAGLVLLIIATRRPDAADRRRQLDRLFAILTDLRQDLKDED